MRKRLGKNGSVSPRGTKRGVCGGVPKRDGSGRGIGNRNKKKIK